VRVADVEPDSGSIREPGRLEAFPHSLDQGPVILERPHEQDVWDLLRPNPRRGSQQQRSHERRDRRHGPFEPYCHLDLPRARYFFDFKPMTGRIRKFSRFTDVAPI
jgi:hypothetical protein